MSHTGHHTKSHMMDRIFHATCPHLARTVAPPIILSYLAISNRAGEPDGPMTVVPIVPLTLASRVGENGRGDGDSSQRAEPTG